jgi:hypothetical protein
MSPSLIRIPTKFISFQPHVKKGYYIRVYANTLEEELEIVRRYLISQQSGE